MLDTDSLEGEVFRRLEGFGWTVEDLAFQLACAGFAVTDRQVAGAVYRLRAAGKVETRGRGLKMVVRATSRGEP